MQFVLIFASLDIQKDFIALKTVAGAKDKRIQAPDSPINKETHTQECDTDETYPKIIEKVPGSTTDKTTQLQTATIKDTKHCDTDKVFYPKKGEYKNIKIAATKTEDNSTKTVDTKYEDKTTKMDAIRIILCPESPQTDQNNC